MIINMQADKNIPLIQLIQPLNVTGEMQQIA